VSHPRKVLGLAAATALVVLAPTVSSASAAITQSSASISPAFGFYDVTATVPPARTVTATTDGTAGDLADIICLYGAASYQTLASDVTIQSDHTVSSPIDESSISGTYCRVVVVDAGSGRPADVSPFEGPYIGGGLYNTSPILGPLTNFYTRQAQRGAYTDFESLGAGGMYNMALFDATGQQGPEIFYDNAYFNSAEHDDGSGALRPDALIDGKKAYTPYEAQNANAGNAGIPALTVDHAVDPDTGHVTIHEAEDLVVCAPDEVTCSSFVPSGLHYERTIVTSHDGRAASLTDVVTNTDTVEHSYDFEYDEFNNDSGATGFRVPGETEYSNRAVGDEVKTGLLPVSTFGIAYDTTNPATGVNNPRGAITVSPQPARLLFDKYDSTTGTAANGFWLGFKDTVPAGGSKTMTQDFSMGESQAEVDGYTSQAEGALDAQSPPSVAIAAPAEGATVNATPVTVTGTASDNKGVTSLKVNGADVSVGGDGTWSAPVTLSEGANTITAVAEDAAGNEGTATRSITYTKPASTTTPPPTPPVAAAVATVTKNGKVKVTRTGSKVTVDTGIKVSCPAGSASCTAAVDARTIKAVAARLKKSNITIAKKTFTIAAGTTKKIVLTLSSKGAKALKRNKKLTVKVTVVAKVGNGAAKTTTRTITIKYPKAKK
jgi:hypothetical protein